MGGDPKIMVPPNHSLKDRVGTMYNHIIKTIHFGGGFPPIFGNIHITSRYDDIACFGCT